MYKYNDFDAAFVAERNKQFRAQVERRISGALSDGAAQKRVGLVLDGRLPAREGSEIFAGDAQVGTVTSGGFSPTLGHPIAMGYVDAAHAEIDTALEVQVRNKRLPARVAKMPFVQHRYFRGS